MKKIWNLSEFGEFEECVLGSYANPEGQTRPPRRPSQKPTRMNVMLGVAVLVASFTISGIRANSQEVSLPVSAIAVCQSVSEEKPPLEGLFLNRFDGDWTEDKENELLTETERRRLAQSREALVEQTIDTIFSNQQESLSLDTPRLDRASVAHLVRQRKIVR